MLKVQARVAPHANKGEENQLLRKAETESNHFFFFFAAIHFKIMMFIMLEISPTEPGRDDVYGSGMGNTVMNVLYSGLMPA